MTKVQTVNTTEPFDSPIWSCIVLNITRASSAPAWLHRISMNRSVMVKELNRKYWVNIYDLTGRYIVYMYMITEFMLFKDLSFAHRESAAYWFSTQDTSCIRALHTEYEQHKFALVFWLHQVSLSFQERARNTGWPGVPPAFSDEGRACHHKNDRKLTPTEKDPRWLVRDWSML